VNADYTIRPYPSGSSQAVANVIVSRTAQLENLRCVASFTLPTKWGIFQALGFERMVCNGVRRVETAVVLVLGELKGDAPPLRIHSQCLTGDVLGSLRCDCGDQLEFAMRTITHERRGILIYEQQEGRGIGLMAKLQAYALQDKGLDTVEANEALGLPIDYRDYSLPAAILQYLSIERVRLLTNNPDKCRALECAGIDVVEKIACEAVPNPDSIAYLKAKRDKMGHTLRLCVSEEPPHARNRPAEDLGADARESASNELFVPGFASIEDAIQELRAAHMIVVVDDEDRENEGDLMMAARWITPEAINFMTHYGRGLICLAMDGERLDDLQLPPMAFSNTALGGTGFSVSIDAKEPGMTTGISARDRAQTIRRAIDPTTRPEDLARPGHVFPLRCQPGGVLERRGHTEAAVDIVSLAGLGRSGVICEILNKDGSMARVPDLVEFCGNHGLKMITIADLVRYRRNHECYDTSRSPWRSAEVQCE
jgi:3,4-dihydroxy-2-butanone 4-phosphate synthase/GTP cyclohydrolase II